MYTVRTRSGRVVGRYRTQAAARACIRRMRGAKSPNEDTRAVVASKNTGDYRVELLDHGDNGYALNVTFTGEWASGAPVEIWLNDETEQPLDADPEDVAKWFKSTLRGDRSVMELLGEARYDQYGNKIGSASSGGAVIARL